MSQIVLQHYTRPANRRHLWIGLALSLVAVTHLGAGIAAWLTAHPQAAAGLQASLFAGLATGIGALPLFFLRRPAASSPALLLGVAGGMMLAASVFSLLVPALEMVAAASRPGFAGAAVALALLAGAAGMQHFDRRLPHTHIEPQQAPPLQRARVPNAGLIVAAIALHNLPEGLAVGVAAAAGADHGISLGIALQNIPEGWIVASTLLALGASPWRAAGLALATGLIEPLGGLVGVIAASLAGAALPLALSAAAGAMFWVVGHELVPAAQAGGRARTGNFGLLCGFAAMTWLSSLF
ncbi:ZIP family metal transporter [Dechloromonas sp. ZY10]|uniref:ZIP family metal transporter n=1 Tax=Dechloromonas aquae TaxID=2664436 RepID=UPI003528EEA0